MKYLLDTNACIRYLNAASEPLRRRLEAADQGDLAVCSVVKAELLFGAVRSRRPERTREHQRAFVERFASLPFDDRAAESYAEIRAALEQRGTPIGANDLMIAAIALANGLVLITHNVAEFSRVSKLCIEDWERD